MISLLIEWGANVFLKNVSNMDVVKIARNDALKVSILFYCNVWLIIPNTNNFHHFQEFIQIKLEQIKNLVSSIANENVEALNEALHNHHYNKRPFASLRSRIYNGQTLIHVAARLGAIPVIELLLEHK